MEVPPPLSPGLTSPGITFIMSHFIYHYKQTANLVINCKYWPLPFQRWLERTPGIESEGYNFWPKFKFAAKRWLEEEFLFPAQVIFHKLQLTSLLN